MNALNRLEKALKSLVTSHTREDIRVRLDVEMAAESAWRIGGTVDAMVTVESPAALIQAIKTFERGDVRWSVIGNTTNLLFSDGRMHGALICLGAGFSEIEWLGQGRIKVGAAAWVPRIARNVALRGFRGLEHAIGIPGTLAGLIVMNGGSEQKCISECVVQVEAVSRIGERSVLSARECGFRRRHSIFQEGLHTIISAELSFDSQVAYREMLPKMRQVMSSRRRKFPMKFPNCGSVFVSDPASYSSFGPPGSMIEACGLKGFRIGGAAIAEQHANFIINLGGASAADVLALIQVARNAVKSKFGVDLRTEVKVVDSDCRILSADEYVIDGLRSD